MAATASLAAKPAASGTRKRLVELANTSMLSRLRVPLAIALDRQCQCDQKKSSVGLGDNQA